VAAAAAASSRDTTSADVHRQLQHAARGDDSAIVVSAIDAALAAAAAAATPAVDGGGVTRAQRLNRLASAKPLNSGTRRAMTERQRQLVRVWCPSARVRDTLYSGKSVMSALSSASSRSALTWYRHCRSSDGC
jgi:hypothetical protein